MGDPRAKKILGTPSGKPLVNGTVTTNNQAMSSILFTRGWTPDKYGLLLPGDYIQLGMRLHRVLDKVNSDASGDATLNIWPSLREQPSDAEAIVLNKPVGLWRLTGPTRKWAADVKRGTAISIQAMEAR
jgi:hypothetical protein